MSATVLAFPRHRVRPFLTPDERGNIEAAIEMLVAVLDVADGDPDVEDTVPEGGVFARGSPDDMEDGHDNERVNEDGDELDQGELDEVATHDWCGVGDCDSNSSRQ